ncbi:TPA: hypothetical protein DIC62_01415 [Candidatus Nomurabacteria bacterium]|nr:hypothetical protein [Candidatus Nomurabacteria bacterium]
MILNKYNYTREKLNNAVYELAVGPGDVRSRLLEAFQKCWFLTEDSFPEELRSDWSWINKEMNKFGPLRDKKGEIRTDAIDNTMARIKNATGVKIAYEIYELRFRMENYINSQNI